MILVSALFSHNFARLRHSIDRAQDVKERAHRGSVIHVDGAEGTQHKRSVSHSVPAPSLHHYSQTELTSTEGDTCPVENRSSKAIHGLQHEVRGVSSGVQVQTRREVSFRGRFRFILCATQGRGVLEPRMINIDSISHTSKNM